MVAGNEEDVEAAEVAVVVVEVAAAVTREKLQNNES